MAIDKRISLTVDAANAKKDIDLLKKEFDRLSTSIKSANKDTNQSSLNLKKYKSFAKTAYSDTAKLTASVISLSKAFDRLNKSINTDKASQYSGKIKAIADDFKRYTDQTKKAARANKELADSFKSIPKSAPSASRPTSGGSSSPVRTGSALGGGATLLAFSGALSNSERITKQSIGAFTQVERATLKYDTALRRLNKSLSQGQIGQKEFDSAVSKAESAYKRSASQTRKLTANTLDLGDAFVGVFAIISGQQVVQAADAYTEFTNKIRLTIQAGESLASTQQKLTDLAVETRTNLNDNSTLYLRLANSLDRASFSQERLLDLQRTINQSIAIGGSTAVEANAALLQFSQAAGADFKAVGQELNSINEQAFGLSDAIIKGLKATDDQFTEFEQSRGIQGRAALKKYAEEGLLSTQKVLVAIESQAERVDKAFKTTDVTVAKSLTNLNTRFTEFVGRLNQSSGATNTLVNAINLVSENLDVVASGFVAIGTAYVAAKIPAIFAAFTAFAVANPIGLIATALAGLIVYWNVNNEKSKAAAAELDKVTKAANAYKKAQEGLTSEQKQGRIETLRQNIALLEQNDALNEALETRARLFVLQKQLSGTEAEAGIVANIRLLNEEIAKAGNNKEKIAQLKAELDKLTGANKSGDSNKKGISGTFGQTSAIAELELLAKYNKEKAIELEYLKAVQEIEQAEGVSRLTKQDALLQAQNAYNSAIIENRVQQSALARESEENTNKIKTALDEYTKSAYDFQSSYAEVVSNSLKGLEDTLVNFAQTGKLSFKDLANSILSDLLRIQIRAQIVAPLAQAGSAFFGGLSSGTTQGASTINGISSAQVSAMAKGGAVINGEQRYAKGGLPSLSSYSGSIVNTPTRFAMGAGLMGESGSEAILPLQRTASGDLGVASTGGGQELMVNVNITNASGQTIQAQETGRRRKGNTVDLDLTLRNAVKSVIGSGAADQEFASRYGQRPVGA